MLVGVVLYLAMWTFIRSLLLVDLINDAMDLPPETFP
jgi:hypothetical protein